MQYQDFSSDGDKGDSLEMTPVIEITQPSDFRDLFIAILHGSEKEYKCLQFMTNAKPEEIRECAALMRDSYDGVEGLIQTKDAVRFLKISCAILERLYKYSKHIDDVPSLRDAAEFLAELGDLIKSKAEAHFVPSATEGIFNEHSFSINRLVYVNRILGRDIEQLPNFEQLQPCISMLNASTDVITTEVLKTLSNCIRYYSRDQRWDEATTCANWVKNAVTRFAYGEAHFFDEKGRAVGYAASTASSNDNTIWDGVKPGMLACGYYYSKIFKPDIAAKCYTVAIEQCREKFFDDRESYQLSLADLLLKRANAYYEAENYESSNKDAKKVIELMQNMGEEGQSCIQDANQILRNSPIETEEFEIDTSGWGVANWDPDKESEDDDGAELA